MIFLIKGEVNDKTDIYTIVLAQPNEWNKYNCVYTIVVAHTRKGNGSSKMKRQERANAQIAHLVFADTQANPEKPKELFFANA